MEDGEYLNRRTDRKDKRLEDEIVSPIAAGVSVATSTAIWSRSVTDHWQYASVAFKRPFVFHFRCTIFFRIGPVRFETGALGSFKNESASGAKTVAILQSVFIENRRHVHSGY